MFVVIKKRTIIYYIVSLLLIIALVIALFTSDIADVYFGYANKEIPIYRVETDKKEIALTFDAAWGSDKTEGIMEILKEFDADATFFLVGFWVESFPQMAKAIADNGYEIGTHSNTHPHFNRLSEKQVNEELDKSVAIIKDKTGFTPTTFRAPFGEYNDRLINACKKKNLSVIQWNVDSYDWKNLPSSDIAAKILTKTSNGSIILMHNNSDHILTFLPVVLTSLKEKGYTFKRVSDLMIKDNFYIDSQGTQRVVV